MLVKTDVKAENAYETRDNNILGNVTFVFL